MDGGRTTQDDRGLDWRGRRLRPGHRARRRLARLRRPRWLALARTEPLSRAWGSERGTPVDRHYIERFLAANAQAIRGDVLEIKDTLYTSRFGTDVRARHVLDVDPGNPDATIVADLAAADAVAADAFDCFILTQTLQLVFDVRAAVFHTHRILRPGGVVLCTVPCVSRIERGLVDVDCWRFTPASCRRLFEEHFGPGRVSVEAHGNVLTSIAFLAGMAAEELSDQQLAVHDQHFPMMMTVRAQKAA